MDIHIFNVILKFIVILVAIVTFYSDSLRVLFGQSSVIIVLLRYLHIRLRFFFYFCFLRSMVSRSSRCCWCSTVELVGLEGGH